MLQLLQSCEQNRYNKIKHKMQGRFIIYINLKYTKKVVLNDFKIHFMGMNVVEILTTQIYRLDDKIILNHRDLLNI